MFKMEVNLFWAMGRRTMTAARVTIGIETTARVKISQGASIFKHGVGSRVNWFTNLDSGKVWGFLDGLQRFFTDWYAGGEAIHIQESCIGWSSTWSVTGHMERHKEALPRPSPSLTTTIKTMKPSNFNSARTKGLLNKAHIDSQLPRVLFWALFWALFWGKELFWALF